MLAFLLVLSPFSTESDASISAIVELTPRKLKQCLVHSVREAQMCEQRIEIYKVLSFESIRLSHRSTHRILCETGFKLCHLSFVPVMDKNVISTLTNDWNLPLPFYMCF